MARKKNPELQEPKALTRAQKTDAAKSVIKELLAEKPHKHNELIEQASKLFSARYVGADSENANDVKGRIGSVLDAMQKSSEIMYDGGMYALKARILMPVAVEEPVKTEEKPAKKTAKKAVKKKDEKPLETAVETPVEVAIEEAPKAEEKPAKKSTKKSKKAEEKTAEIATEETVKKEPKKRAKKVKEKSEETPVSEVPKTEEITAEIPEVSVGKEERKPVEEKALVVKEKAELAKTEIVDMSFLLGGAKKAQETPAQTPQKTDEKRVEKSEEKPTLKTENKKPQPTQKKAPLQERLHVRKPQAKPLTAEEKLKENFLKRIRSLGGDYFEYYSVYLLERYSMKNGRRLEGMKISGGEHDGGIDGELELTDKFGFRETIYVQSKNWNPEKGKEENWVVGETLLQQFIGACACRQARDRKQHCRGIFVTTSRFTPDAKRILETMGDKIVGYDGADLFDAAKECQFGLLYENGNWKLDEKLLSGTKAFFNML